MVDERFDWMEEFVERIEKNNGFYRFLCFFLGRKMRYKELYMLLSAVNKRKMGAEKAKEWAFNRIIKTYKFLNNNQLPKGIE